MRDHDATNDHRRLGHLGAALGLLGLLAALAVPGRSARAGGDPTQAVAAVSRQATVADDSVYLSPPTMGAVVVRPAATLRRLGSDRELRLARAATNECIGRLAALLEVDPAQPGFRQLEVADIEAITLGFSMKQATVKSVDPARADSHNFTGTTTGCVVRAVAATDWPTVLRGWGVEVEELRGCHPSYYKLRLPERSGIIDPLCAFLPDDRTLVVDDKGEVETLIRRTAPAAPPFLQGADWQEANRGLAAIALDNRNGQMLNLLTGAFEVDGLLVGTVFLGVERWVACLADADAIGVSAAATTRNPLAAGVLGWGLAKAIDLARGEAKSQPPSDPWLARVALEGDDAIAKIAQLSVKVDRMPTDALARLQVAVNGSMVRVGTAGFGTYAEIGEMLLILCADDLGIEVQEMFFPEALTKPAAARP